MKNKGGSARKSIAEELSFLGPIFAFSHLAFLAPDPGGGSFSMVESFSNFVFVVMGTTYPDIEYIVSSRNLEKKFRALVTKGFPLKLIFMMFSLISFFA